MARTLGRRLAGLTAIALAVPIGIGVAYADNVQNNLDGSIDATAKEMSLSVGGATGSTTLFIDPTTGDGKNGCNLTGSTTLSLSVSSWNTTVATVSPSSVTFTSCGDTKLLTVTPIAVGTATVTVAQTFNNTGGTFDLGPATFTVNVTGDTTPPVITKTITGAAGTNGWHTSNTTVTWTVSDAQSPVVIDSGCGVQTFTTETAGSASSCVAHSAGGSASDSVTVKIDKSGPSATLNATGTSGANGWFVSDVSVATTGADSISGPITCTAAQLLTAQTAGQTVNGSCTNSAGLSTQAAPITVKIDKTGPSAELSVAAGDLGSNGWYTSEVSVATNGSDDISTVTCNADQIVNAEGTTRVNGVCTNDAGLSTAADPLVVKIDMTNPTATISLSGSLGSNGWYTSPVEATTTGADTISEPVTCTAPQHFAEDTTGVTVNGSCTNNAGLVQNADSVDLKIDQSAPTDVALTVTAGTEGANSWYTSDVTIATTGNDPTSGVTCTADQTISAEGTTIVTGSCTNGAGLTADAVPLTIKLDKTGPSAALSVTAGTEGANGWYISNVAIETTGSDSISGPVTCTGLQAVSTETTGQAVNGSCTNAAGLITDAVPLTIKLDKTGPSAALSVTGGTLGNNGWYVTDITVTTTGADLVSEPVTCTAPQTFTDETSRQSVNGTCTNNAGLTTTATPLPIKIDKTSPSVSMIGGPADEASYDFGNVPGMPSCSGSDATSGLVTCTITGYGTAVGTYAVVATATDNAGNASWVSRTYTVKAWTIGGFYQPVDMGNVWNTVKNGSTVPLKFELFAGTTELTATTAIKSYTVGAISCATISTTVLDEIEFTSTGGTSLRYDATGGQFIQNWQTPKKPGTCYLVTMTALDDSAIRAYFKLK